MKLENIKTNVDMLQFLENLRNWPDSDIETQYDGNLILGFFIALLENLRINSIEIDWEELPYNLTIEQKLFLSQIVEYANQALQDEEK